MCVYNGKGRKRRGEGGEVECEVKWERVGKVRKR